MTDSVSSKDAEVRRLATLVKKQLEEESPAVGDLPRRARLLAREVLCREGCITFLNEVLDVLLADVNNRIAQGRRVSMEIRPTVKDNGWVDRYEKGQDERRAS